MGSPGHCWQFKYELYRTLTAKAPEVLDRSSEPRNRLSNSGFCGSTQHIGKSGQSPQPFLSTGTSRQIVSLASCLVFQYISRFILRWFDLERPINESNLLRLAAVAAVLLSIAAAAFPASAKDGEVFLPSADAQADVDRALEKAREGGRLVLIVLGANWCHDSRALAARLEKKPLRRVVEKHYETVFVDTGYYEKGFEVVRRFGSPIYYATPTVLIVDPQAGRLVNAGNRHQWANAHDIGMQESVDYFEQMTADDPAGKTQAVPSSDELDRLYQQIRDWELQLAQRVKVAYGVVGPMLKAYKEGDAPAEFHSRWDELSDIRSAIPQRVEALYAEADRRVAEGEVGIELEFPEYPSFSWQSASD